MAKTTKKPRPWSKEDVQALKTMVREKTATATIVLLPPLPACAMHKVVS